MVSSTPPPSRCHHQASVTRNATVGVFFPLSTPPLLESPPATSLTPWYNPVAPIPLKATECNVSFLFDDYPVDTVCLQTPTMRQGGRQRQIGRPRQQQLQLQLPTPRTKTTTANNENGRAGATTSTVRPIFLSYLLTALTYRTILSRQHTSPPTPSTKRD